MGLLLCPAVHKLGDAQSTNLPKKSRHKKTVKVLIVSKHTWSICKHTCMPVGAFPSSKQCSSSVIITHYAGSASKWHQRDTRKQHSVATGCLLNMVKVSLANAHASHLKQVQTIHGLNQSDRMEESATEKYLFCAN